MHGQNKKKTSIDWLRLARGPHSFFSLKICMISSFLTIGTKKIKIKMASCVSTYKVFRLISLLINC